MLASSVLAKKSVQFARVRLTGTCGLHNAGSQMLADMNARVPVGPQRLRVTLPALLSDVRLA